MPAARKAWDLESVGNKAASQAIFMECRFEIRVYPIQSS
jgi:hypothetical protein